MPNAPAERPIVVVEDSDEDFTALRWALQKIGVDRPLRRCANGAELFAYLRRGDGDAPKSPAPGLIFLDLNLGADDGRELLEELKADAALRRIPVVVWTTSTHPQDVDHCYAHGASGYARKPADVEQLLGALRDVTRYWFSCVVLPEPGPVGHA